MNPWTELLIEARQQLLANPVLAPIPFVIEHEGQPISIIERSRAANVATVKTTKPHGLKNADHVRIEQMSEDSYDADDVVATVVNATTFTYASNGDNEAVTAEAAGMVVPLLVPIDASLNASLAKGGLLKNSAGKGGMAILLMTPKGIAGGNMRGQASQSRDLSPQTTTLRVAIFVRPLINAGGLKIQPFEALYAVQRSMMSWDRGPGQQANALNNWDSRENPEGELSYFADFEIPQFISLAD